MHATSSVSEGLSALRKPKLVKPSPFSVFSAGAGSLQEVRKMAVKAKVKDKIFFICPFFIALIPYCLFRAHSNHEFSSCGDLIMGNISSF